MQPHQQLPKRELESLPDAADSALNGVFSDKAFVVEDWLIWSQGDGPATRRHWLHLKESGAIQDRDRYVLELWKSVDRTNGSNHSAKKTIEERSAPWEYYKRHFFGWFLSRFNLAAARQVFSDNKLVARLHYLFSLVSLVASIFALRRGAPFSLAYSLLFLGAVAVLLVLVSLVSGIPKYAYVHSLIPRLGAAVGIGYLFLASASHLVKAIDRLSLELPELLLILAGLIGATLLYIPVHIYRRVYPPPKTKELFQLGLDIVVLGVGYAALELLLFAPLLFSRTFICEVNTDCSVNAHPASLALCAAVALVLGVVLQLAWDEKPLTEPL